MLRPSYQLLYSPLQLEEVIKEGIPYISRQTLGNQLVCYGGTVAPYCHWVLFGECTYILTNQFQISAGHPGSQNIKANRDFDLVKKSYKSPNSSKHIQTTSNTIRFLSNKMLLPKFPPLFFRPSNGIWRYLWRSGDWSALLTPGWCITLRTTQAGAPSWILATNGRSGCVILKFIVTLQLSIIYLSLKFVHVSN